MKSSEIQETLYHWILERGFNAPYGILLSEHYTSKGRKYLTITFGRPRTLDATISIYNCNFITLRTNTLGMQAFRSVADLQQVLETL